MRSLSSTFSSSHAVADAALLRRAARSLSTWLAFAVPAVWAVHVWYGAVPLTHFDQRMLDFRARRPEIQVLILGSSQLARGVDPGLVAEAAFNMAGVSQDLYYDGRIALDHLDAMPALRAVVWELSPLRLGYDLARTEGEGRLIKLYDPHFPRRFEGEGPSALHSTLNFLRVRGGDPIRTFAELVAGSVGPRYREQFPNADGFAPQPPTEERDNGARRARFHAGLYREEMVVANVALLRDAARRLGQRGVAVLFVTPPSLPGYRAAIPPAILARFERATAPLLAEPGVRYVDLSDAVPPGRGWFRDADHLQGRGIEVFSSRLARLVTEPTP